MDSSLRYTTHTGTNGFSGMKELFSGQPKLSKSMRSSLEKSKIVQKIYSAAMANDFADADIKIKENSGFLVGKEK